MAEVLEPLEAPPVEDEPGALSPLVVQFEPVITMDDEQFFQFCVLNNELQIERTAEGEIILAHPEGLSPAPATLC